MAARQASKEVEFHQAVMSFFGLSKRIANRENLDNMEAELNKIAAALSRDPASFAGAVRLVADLQPAASSPAIPAAPMRVKPVQWSKHSKGKARSWLASWEGMTLRVDRRKTGDMGVIFEGFIDDKPAARGKLLTQVQTELAAEAYRLATRR